MTAENESLVERLRKRATAFNDAGLRYGVADLLNEAADSESALLDRLRTAEAERDDLRDKLTRPLPPDSHDADWWRRTSSFWAGQDEMHERALHAAEARAAEAEAVIAEAPHPDDCEISPWGNACTCWKSRYPKGATHD